MTHPALQLACTAQHVREQRIAAMASLDSLLELAPGAVSDEEMPAHLHGHPAGHKRGGDDASATESEVSMLTICCSIQVGVRCRSLAIMVAAFLHMYGCCRDCTT